MPSSSNSLVRLAKWTVGYKEDAPSTISSSVYIKELTQNPGEGVSVFEEEKGVFDSDLTDSSLPCFYPSFFLPG